MVNQIFISNMSTDDNKGDLAILENTILLLKEVHSESRIIIQNVDYTQNDIQQFQLHRWSRKLAEEYFGSFFPGVFLGRKDKIIALTVALKNALVSFLLLICAAMTQILKRYFGFMVFGRHRKVWRALQKSDLVIVKGGSYIYSYGGVKDLLFLYRMLLTPFIAMLLGKRVIFWGHSIGPIEGRIQQYWARVILNRAHCIMVREKLSFHYIKETLGIAGPAVEIIPDLAFIHAKSASHHDSLDSILKREGVHITTKNDPWIGLTVRDWHFPGSEDPARLRREYISALIEAIHYLRDTFNAVVFFVPHCLTDLPFAHTVYQGVKDKTNVHVLKGDYSTGEMRTLLASMDLIIGARIHSNILALSIGTPVVPIVYQRHKGFGIMEMAGVDKSFIFDISDIDLHRLKEKLSYLLQKPINAQQRQLLRDRVASLQSEIRKTTHFYIQ